MRKKRAVYQPRNGPASRFDRQKGSRKNLLSASFLSTHFQRSARDILDIEGNVCYKYLKDFKYNFKERRRGC
jgi:hypothetical protein